MEEERSTPLPCNYDDIQSLLDDFDVLHQEFKNGTSKIQMLKFELSLEAEKRVAAETIRDCIEKDRQRLQKCQEDRINTVSDQLEYRSKYESLKQLSESNEKKHKETLALLNEQSKCEAGDLQNQIRQQQEQLALKDVVLAQLEQEISHLGSAVEALQKKLLQTREEEDQKYKSEVENLRKELSLEKEEKLKIQEELRQMENSSKVARSKYEEHIRELGSNRHADAFKQKIMKLRKENEELKQKLRSAGKY